MKVVTWNVNSVRARCERVYQWIKRHQPDVVCLQETKCVDGAYPRREFELLGYSSIFHGQKSYNGVAILSPHPIHDVFKGFVDLGEGEDPQARLIAGTIQGVRIISAYVPNGGRVGTTPFDYKLAWLERLRAQYLDVHHDPAEDLLLCGDFNVAPEDEDVWDADFWRDSIICHEDARAALERVTSFGLHDTFRQHHPDKTRAFSWWDYTPSSLKLNRGVRIDFVLATESMRQRCTHASIDLEEREQEKPSDHAPVLATFSMG